LVGGSGIIEAMITMAAPQTGHVMDGRCFNFPASQRHRESRHLLRSALFRRLAPEQDISPGRFGRQAYNFPFAPQVSAAIGLPVGRLCSTFMINGMEG
jgi:hypothetical protein